jgi:hypothetical protein
VKFTPSFPKKVIVQSINQIEQSQVIMLLHSHGDQLMTTKAKGKPAMYGLESVSKAQL